MPAKAGIPWAVLHLYPEIPAFGGSTV